MEKIEIKFIPAFQDQNRLARLNSFILRRNTVMPHEVAAATGCSIQESITLLLYLYHRYLADPYLLTFHTHHPLVVIEKTHLKEGLPELPIICDHCEEQILNPDELIYEFEFNLRGEIQFYV